METLRAYLKKIQSGDDSCDKFKLTEENIEGTNFTIVLKPLEEKLVIGFEIMGNHKKEYLGYKSIESTTIFAIQSFQISGNFILDIGKIYDFISSFIGKARRKLSAPYFGVELFGEMRKIIFIDDLQKFCKYFGEENRVEYPEPFYLFIKVKDQNVKVKIIEAKKTSDAVQVKRNYVNKELLSFEIRKCFLNFLGYYTSLTK